MRFFTSEIYINNNNPSKIGAFLAIFKDFCNSIGSARPQLLIFDGHSSHDNIELIELARKENIILVELPSHTSN